MRVRQLRLPWFGLALLLVFGAACSSPAAKTPTSAPTVAVPLLPTVTGKAPAVRTPTVAAPTTRPSTPTPSVSVTKDLVYATSLVEEGHDWTLDAYMPFQVGGGPIIVLLHGLGATKEGYVRESEFIAKSGALVYAVNWPIREPGFASRDNARRYREMSETLTCAIRFARVAAADFLGADQVILIAHSYGALYGAWMALASENLETQWEEYLAGKEAPAAQIDCAASSGSVPVDAFIGIGGGRYAETERIKERDPELWEIVSPYANIGERLDMPVRLLHGTQDPIAKPESSHMFNDALVEAGHDSRVTLFDGGHIVPAELTAETVLELVDTLKP